MAKLTVEIDNRPVQVVRIDDIVAIGRDSNNDIQIIDGKVSRRHSVVEKKKEYYIVRDLNSRNGTYVNDVLIKESNLSSGDRIRVGNTEILFSEEPFQDTKSVHKPDLLTSQSFNQIKMLDHTFELKNLAQVDLEKETKKDLQKAMDKLTTLFEVGNIINVVRDSDSLMNAILEQITRIIEADRSYLLLKDEQSGKLIPAAVRTDESNEVEPKISNTILNLVMDDGISILSPDAFQDERFQGSDSIFVHSIRSTMCVPLRSRDKTLGIIHVDTRGTHDTFTENDLKMLTAIGISAGTAIENIRLYENLKKLFRSTVKSIVATIEANDYYTGGHSVRVAGYSKQIALSLGLPEDVIEQVEMAAFLHDVGKVGIPDKILTKPGKFTSDEAKIMQRHPIIGADILSNIDGMEEIALIVKHHHESFDGSGYPDSLKGEDIPLGSRILCLADALDAITTDRSYRKKKPLEQAVQEMDICKNIQFDPELIKIFKKCIAAGLIRMNND